MQATINADLVKKLTPKEKPFEVWDNTLKGFIVRIQPSGIKTYIVEYARHKRITIGQISAISTSGARKEAAKRIAGYIQGNDPQEEKKAKKALTFEEFMNERYAPWCKLHHRRPTDTTRMLERSYPYIGNRKLAEIDAWSIERFRSTLLKTMKPVTVNKTLAVLRAALYKAIDWELLKEHPMLKVKPIRVDDATRVRYLTPDENQRLREALDARETKLRNERSHSNKWRRERGLDEHPDYGMFTGYLKPITLLALNTGMRKGELFNLKWQHVNLPGRMLTVAGETAKTKKTRYIPLNEEAMSVLQGCYEQRKESEMVFPNHDGDKLYSIYVAWMNLLEAAQIDDFRFHDCRHDFASRLVMADVDLNTVRELLGHANIKMTLRYAHLAPQKLASAVAKLNAA